MCLSKTSHLVFFVHILKCIIFSQYDLQLIIFWHGFLFVWQLNELNRNKSSHAQMNNGCVVTLKVCVVTAPFIKSCEILFNKPKMHINCCQMSILATIMINTLKIQLPQARLNSCKILYQHHSSYDSLADIIGTIHINCKWIGRKQVPYCLVQTIVQKHSPNQYSHKKALCLLPLDSPLCCSDAIDIVLKFKPRKSCRTKPHLVF